MRGAKCHLVLRSVCPGRSWEELQRQVVRGRGPRQGNLCQRGVTLGSTLAASAWVRSRRPGAAHPAHPGRGAARLTRLPSTLLAPARGGHGGAAGAAGKSRCPCGAECRARALRAPGALAARDPVHAPRAAPRARSAAAAPSAPGERKSGAARDRGCQGPAGVAGSGVGAFLAAGVLQALRFLPGVGAVRIKVGWGWTRWGW